ncbi:hypothetical protein HOH45_07190 [bacterium]|nr:hypothetical protein [bacterium]
MTPLKIVLLYTSGHIGSAITLNRLVHSKEYQIIGIIKTPLVSLSFRGKKSIVSQMKKMGWQFGWVLIWQKAWHFVMRLLSGLIPFKRHLLWPSIKIATKLKIPILSLKSINNPESTCFIKDLGPDLLISAYLNQIIKEPLLSSPKIGILNVHPGWLPAYRGVMAYFWVLKNGEDEAGVTIHWIDHGIDTGNILMRKKFKIHDGMTQFDVLVKSAIVGVHLLRSIGKKIINDDPLPHIKTIEAHTDYYSFPCETAFNHYFKKHNFFNIRSILNLFMKQKL